MSLSGTMLQTSRALADTGLCVLAANRKAKRPAAKSWKTFQVRKPTYDEFTEMAARPDADAICLVCGKASGNLELLDFDCQGEAFDAWAALVCAELPDILEAMLIEKSQSGGRHVVYLCEIPVGGNTKLATKIIAAQAEGETVYKDKTYKVTRNGDRLEAYPVIIETRGEGGIFLCWPSPRYEVIQGDFHCIPLITARQREVFHRCAAALDEKPETPRITPDEAKAFSPTAGGSGELRPGDDYQSRGNLADSLLRAGWTLAGKTPVNELWRRPGKTESDSWSATFNGAVFYVFSSNAEPFKGETGYGKFQAYTLLEHGGDYQAAARALGQAGYGEQGGRRESTSGQEPPPPDTDEPPPPEFSDTIDVDGQDTQPDGEPGAKPKTRKKKGPPPLKAGQIYLYADHPDMMAAEFARARHMRDETLTLRRHNEEWLAWNGRHYAAATDADLKVDIRRFMARHVLVTGDRLLFPNTHLVNEAHAALEAVCNVPADTELPIMLPGPQARPITSPATVIAFTNGLYDIDTGTLHEHTPAWFSRNALEYPYDPAATCPMWDEFIKEASQTELDWIDALQMWFGYNLIADTNQQKMMLLVGPPRSGKGTVCRTLQHVIGKHNYCNPPLGSLAESFGMEPLIGKLSAIVPDAHMGRHGDSVRIMESLKSIIGEDHQTIRPIYRAAVNTKLIVRFTISVNELVLFPDASGSMASRTIILPFRTSHVGEEDTTLSTRLATEASGIANWAIEGILKLKTAGKLIQPQAGQQILDDFSRLSSPIRGFVSDYCAYPTKSSVLCTQLRSMWAVWCEENGHEAGSEGKFGERLYAACPSVKRVRRGPKGAQDRRYEGIALTEEALSLYDERKYRGKLPEF